MNSKAVAFKEKNARSFVCGEQGFKNNAKKQGRAFLDLFKEKVTLKDLDGKTLYEGKVWKWQGKDKAFQRCVEQAVGKGIALPKLDARNRKFIGMQIPGASIPGASFAGSEIISEPICNTSRYGAYYIGQRHSSFAKANLQDVDFGKTQIDAGTMVMGCDVLGANFKDQENLRKKLDGFAMMKNLDKAEAVNKKDLAVWQKAQGAKNSKSAVNVAQAKVNQGR